MVVAATGRMAGKADPPSEARRAQLLYCAICLATRRNKAIAPYDARTRRCPDLTAAWALSRYLHFGQNELDFSQ
jgi:hypothetical protein